MSRPILGIDGNLWYLLDGGDLMTGRCAFARTIGEVKDEYEKRYDVWPRLPHPFDHAGFDAMTPEEYRSERNGMTTQPQQKDSYDKDA